MAIGPPSVGREAAGGDGAGRRCRPPPTIGGRAARRRAAVRADADAEARAGRCSSWSRIARARPGNPTPSRRRLPIAQASPASTGVVSSSMSLPYRQARPPAAGCRARRARPAAPRAGPAAARASASACVGGRPRSRTRPRRCSRERLRPAPGRRAICACGHAHEGQRGRPPAPAAPARRPPPGPAAPAAPDPHAARSVTPAGSAGRRYGGRSTCLRLALTTRNSRSPQVGDHQVVEDAAGLVQSAACSAGGPASARRCRRAPALPAPPRRRRRAGSAWPMCDTSNSAAPARHCRCSAMMPAGYCTGMA